MCLFDEGIIQAYLCSIRVSRFAVPGHPSFQIGALLDEPQQEIPIAEQGHQNQRGSKLIDVWRSSDKEAIPPLVGCSRSPRNAARFLQCRLFRQSNFESFSKIRQTWREKVACFQAHPEADTTWLERFHASFKSKKRQTQLMPAAIRIRR
jgi:hypothetical protein